MMRVCAALLLVLPAVRCFAADVTLGIETSAGGSDNITRTAFNEQSETIRSLGVAASLTHASEKLNTFLRGDVRYNDYLHGTVPDETLRAFDGFAIITPVEGAFGSFRWQLLENLGQQVLNPFLVATPENRQEVNYWTTGPLLEFNLGTRTQLDLEGRVSSLDYEVTPGDNDRTGATVVLNRFLTSRSQVGIGGRTDRVEYVEPFSASDFERSEVFLRYGVELSRLTVNLEVGENEIEMASGTADGGLLGLQLQKRVGSFSTFFVRANKSFSDAGNLFRQFQTGDRVVGRSLDVVGTTDPFEGRLSSIGLTTERPQSVFSVELWQSDEAYFNRPEFDRTVTSFDIALERRLGVAWSVGVETRFSERDFASGRVDDDVLGTLAFSRDVTSVLRLDIELQRRDRETAGLEEQRTENRMVITLAYVPLRSVE